MMKKVLYVNNTKLASSGGRQVHEIHASELSPPSLRRRLEIEAQIREATAEALKASREAPRELLESLHAAGPKQLLRLQERIAELAAEKKTLGKNLLLRARVLEGRQLSAGMVLYLSRKRVLHVPTETLEHAKASELEHVADLEE